MTALFAQERRSKNMIKLPVFKKKWLYDNDNKVIISV